MSVLLDNFFIAMILLPFCCTYGQKPVCCNEYMFNDSISRAKIIEADRILSQHLANNVANSRSEITIPVVVHIVWQKQEENLSDAIILSQIAASSRDYNAENIDIEETPDEFKPFLGKTGIHFCLAAIDPQGNASTGIVRVHTNKANIGLSEDVFFNSNGGSDAWDTQKYLNIWVASTGNEISGLGTYPNQSLPEKTGVIIHPKYFGVNGHSKYGLGRTLTHEIGHYLGLKHLWADDTDCATDDEVEDTPVQQNAHLGCPSYPQVGCSPSEMSCNFMDYVNDRCMVMFTKGQADRMQATLNTYRSGLLASSPSCITPHEIENNKLTIYPNPSNGIYNCIYFSAPMKIIEYKLYDCTGRCVVQEEKLVNTAFNIDLHSFSVGIYFMVIEGKTYKLVKM